jgi:diketogulonate reductase-like aldo/keto reductase
VRPIRFSITLRGAVRSSICCHGLPDGTCPPLDDIASARGVSVFQVALAWALQQPGVFAIPKAGRIEHVRDNHRALDLQLGADECAVIDAYFRPPRSKRPLEML